MKYIIITNKSIQIPFLLFRFRFLTLKQTQLLLHHKDHKTTRLWLKHLLKNNYIGKHEEVRSPGYNAPATYYLEKDGLLFLKDQPGIEKSYLNKMNDENKKKQPFICEHLFITTTCLYLSDQAKNNGYTLKF